MASASSLLTPTSESAVFVPDRGTAESGEPGAFRGKFTLRRLLPATTIYMEVWRPPFSPGGSVLIDGPGAGAGQRQVTLPGVKGNQVRIGIAAPDDITILREDLRPGRRPLRRHFYPMHARFAKLAQNCNFQAKREELGGTALLISSSPTSESLPRD